MIRTTYRGRELKILAARRPNEYRIVVNGHQIHNGFQTVAEAYALDWLRAYIDRLDARGPGNNRAETEPWWYEPGTYRLNAAGHVIGLDGVGCICDVCLMNPARNVPAAA